MKCSPWFSPTRVNRPSPGAKKRQGTKPSRHFPDGWSLRPPGRNNSAAAARRRRKGLLQEFRCGRLRTCLGFRCLSVRADDFVCDRGRTFLVVEHPGNVSRWRRDSVSGCGPEPPRMLRTAGCGRLPAPPSQGKACFGATPTLSMVAGKGMPDPVRPRALVTALIGTTAECYRPRLRSTRASSDWRSIQFRR
jgi:hypothetical protein